MDPQFKIDILLSTYNGEIYLNTLLGSILDQSFTDWRLFIRDDGSQDKTLPILEDYCRRYPHKIVLISQQEGNLKSKLSFGRLMECSTAPYVMLCDQDDVWLKNKIQLSFNKLSELEEKHGYHTPLLVHTDSFLTDQDLNVISPSAQHYVGFDRPKAADFRNLILCNVVVGNTVMMNRALVKLSCPIPEDAFMHDWWAAILASAFGAIAYIPEATIYNRQHGHNVCGLRKIKVSDILLNFSNEYKKYYQHQDLVMKQLKAFYQRLGPLSENKNVSKEVLMASSLANLGELGFWRRKFFLFSFYKGFIYRKKALADLIFYFKVYQ